MVRRVPNQTDQNVLQNVPQDVPVNLVQGEPDLFKCEPDSWRWMHPTARYALGWTYLVLFSASFLLLPVSGVILMVPYVWRNYPLTALSFLSLLVISTRVPTREWPAARSWAQLWYEIFRVSVNMSPETRKKYLAMGESHNFAVCMHPHGIIPFHALLWAAYCDQYMKDEETGRHLYGFGAVADIVMQMPLQRTMMVSDDSDEDNCYDDSNGTRNDNNICEHHADHFLYFVGSQYARTLRRLVR